MVKISCLSMPNPIRDTECLKKIFLPVFCGMCCKLWIFSISCLTKLRPLRTMIFLCLTLKLSANQKDMSKQISKPQRTLQRIVPGTVEPHRSMRIKPAGTYIPWRLLYRRLSPECNVYFKYSENQQVFQGIYRQSLDFNFSNI